ncbi:MAG: DUF418 domain-containing protein [Tannerellaceae bacterium]|nr:DUF418 domain-containing protein [Tannerellaceae bacterium]
MKNESVKNVRIDLVGALRGFALMGIILVHNVEHFDIANTVISSSPVLQFMDDFLYDTMFFLFGGKAYAMFALLFGFSFYIQFENQKKKGNAFAGRFAWRMAILFCFGVFHVLFYSGEILSCYAIAGLLLIPFRNVSNRGLLVIAVICMLEPWEMIKLFYSFFNTSYVPAPMDWSYYLEAVEVATRGNFIGEVMKVNLIDGMLSAHLFAWSSGRYFQTLSLFMLGMLAGRKSLFIPSETTRIFWKKVLFCSIPAFLVLYIFKLSQAFWDLRPAIEEPMSILTHMWSNFAFMCFLVSSFVLLWFNGVKRLLSKLIPYGRMSLSNYILSSMIGSFLYYNYGMGLWDKLGSTYSLLIGITVFITQLLISRWWLDRFRQGPLEKLWRTLTWAGSKRNITKKCK